MSRSPDKIRDWGIERFNKLAATKFDAGQAEHKGCLDERVTFAHMEEEIIDLWFYVQSMRIKSAVTEGELEYLRTCRATEAALRKKNEELLISNEIDGRTLEIDPWEDSNA